MQFSTSIVHCLISVGLKVHSRSTEFNSKVDSRVLTVPIDLACACLGLDETEQTALKMENGLFCFFCMD